MAVIAAAVSVGLRRHGRHGGLRALAGGTVPGVRLRCLTPQFRSPAQRLGLTALARRRLPAFIPGGMAGVALGLVPVADACGHIVKLADRQAPVRLSPCRRKRAQQVAARGCSCCCLPLLPRIAQLDGRAITGVAHWFRRAP